MSPSSSLLILQENLCLDHEIYENEKSQATERKST